MLEQLNCISATGGCKWCSVPIWLASFKYEHGAKMPVIVYSKAGGVKILAVPDHHEIGLRGFIHHVPLSFISAGSPMDAIRLVLWTEAITSDEDIPSRHRFRLLVGSHPFRTVSNLRSISCMFRRFLGSSKVIVKSGQKPSVVISRLPSSHRIYNDRYSRPHRGSVPMPTVAAFKNDDTIGQRQHCVLSWIV